MPSWLAWKPLSPTVVFSSVRHSLPADCAHVRRWCLGCLRGSVADWVCGRHNGVSAAWSLSSAKQNAGLATTTQPFLSSVLATAGSGVGQSVDRLTSRIVAGCDSRFRQPCCVSILAVSFVAVGTCSWSSCLLLHRTLQRLYDKRTLWQQIATFLVGSVPTAPLGLACALQCFSAAWCLCCATMRPFLHHSTPLDAFTHWSAVFAARKERIGHCWKWTCEPRGLANPVRMQTSSPTCRRCRQPL